MNETSILMYLLSKKDQLYEIGSTKEEILDKLQISGRNKHFIFRKLLSELSNYISPLGLVIQYNPLNVHWFLAFKRKMTDLILANPFQDKPRLAATLFCTIILCLKNNGITKIDELQKLRQRKDIRNDLKDLEKLGYLKILKNNNEIKLTSLIGYQLNLENLFMKLSLKLTNQGKST
jgi:hypothetical protein